MDDYLRASLILALKPLRLLLRDGSLAVQKLVKEALTAIDVNDLLGRTINENPAMDKKAAPRNWTDLHEQYDLDAAIITQAGLSLMLLFDVQDTAHDDGALETMVLANYALAHQLAGMIQKI